MDQLQLREVLREALISHVDHIEDVNDDLFIEVGRHGFIIRIRPWHPGFHTPATIEGTLDREAGRESDSTRTSDPD